MKYFLIGKKLGHSFSPEIHAFLGDYDYSLKELEEDQLSEFLKKKDFSGINVTIPYKEKIIPLLDEISQEAREIGAVNTVVNHNGKLVGYNTDYYGLAYTIKKLGISIKGKVCAVLGKGGASKTAVTLLNDLKCKKVVIVSRNGRYNYQDLKNQKDLQVIVNATPIGMYPDNGNCLVDLNDFPNLEGVIDLVYNPYVTELIFRAKQLNIKAINGLSMLVAQAKKASELFTGKKIPDDKIPEIEGKIKKKVQNLLLIGMPSSGKSSIGAVLSKKLNKEFIDADEYFTTKFSISPKEYILTYGEEKFRDKECEVIKEICSLSGKVIATGGGAILREENRKFIKSNGVVLYIKRDLSLLSGKDRPLSSDKDKIKKLFEVRSPIYEKTADLIVDGNHTVIEVAEDILRKLF